MDWESIVKWLEGIPGWFIDMLKGFASWLISFLQGSWPAITDTFGVIIQNPTPLAIGLAVGIGVILLGLVIGQMIFRRRDRKSSTSNVDEGEIEDESDVTDNDDSDFYREDSNSLLDKRQ